jgi:kinesin family protein 6/9
MKEGKSINLSLHFLEQVIISLRDQAKDIAMKEKQKNISNNGAIFTTKQKSDRNQTHSNSHYIPYRNSVLTNLLRDSLGGNCKSCFFLMINSNEEYIEETITTCRYLID